MTKCEIIKKFDTEINLRYQSGQTISAYKNCLRKYVKTNSKIDRMTKEQIKYYLIGFKNKYCVSYYNQMVAMLKILYSMVLKQCQKTKHLTFLAQPDSLVHVLDVDYVRSAISDTKNIKHRAILATLFITGIRVSELLSIELPSVNSVDRTIHIKSGKGRKDRFVPINDSLIQLLRDYFKRYRPKLYLFEGIGEKYSASSVRNICKRAGINNPHLLRHSIITHLIDSGDQQMKVQMFAGHKSPKSTMKYYHMAPNALNSLSVPELTTAYGRK